MPVSDLYSTPSKYLEGKFSNKPDEGLILGPICPNIDCRYKVLKDQCRIRTPRLQIDKLSAQIFK